ncbi:MAG: tetratricopeptide repeat protein [Thermodesulfobacteriota bacterium]
MGKAMCSACGQSRAKRVCIGEQGRRLCPVCCATLRSDACEGCTHYNAAEKYRRENPRERKFITMLDPDLDAACDDAFSLVEAGRLEEAEERIRKLYALHPRYHTVQFGMGLCRIKRGKYEEGAEFFRRAVEIFPLFTEAHFNLGMACMQLFDVPGMVASFREVVRLGEDPDIVSKAKRMLDDLEGFTRKEHGVSLDAFLKNGETFKKAFNALEERKYELAVELFCRIVAAVPKNVQSWGNLGLAYAGLGMKAKALECLDKALEIDPRYELAMLNRAVVEAMEEGKPSAGKLESVDYYRDYGRSTGKSYIAEMLGKGG